MQTNQLLSEDNHFKWLLVRLMDAHQRQFLSISQCMETLGLSKYLTQKYLDDIVFDSEQIHLPLTIHVEPSGEIQTSHISNLFLKKMRAYWFETSDTFRVFQEVLFHKHSSLEALARKLFISKSKTYQEIKRLKDIIYPSGMRINQLKVVGDERHVRVIIYSIFKDIYSGLDVPVDKDVLKQIDTWISFMVPPKQLISKTQQLKIQLFLIISILRNRQGHVIRHNPVSLAPGHPYPWERVNHLFSIPMDSAEKEMSFYYLFFYVEQLQPNDKWLVYTDTTLENQVDLLQHNVLTTLIETFPQISSHYEVLANNFLKIHRRAVYFGFRETTFIYDNQHSYFQELHPQLDTCLKQVVEQSQHILTQSTTEQHVKLYYDYLFLILSHLSIDDLEEPIHICVDFSHGAWYNTYIEKMIMSFQSSSFVFENYHPQTTQLYVSDFYIDRLNCEQIIWKNPPNAMDWQLFGNSVVSLKE